jgi:hypothetical protein
MIGGYLQVGNPVANMYFVLFGYNSVYQGQLLLKDLKFAQYAVRWAIKGVIQLQSLTKSSICVHAPLLSCKWSEPSSA